MTDGGGSPGPVRGAPVSYPFPAPPGQGGAVEVAPGILWLRLPLPMALDHVNVYALDDGGAWTLVDTGLDTRKTRAVWDELLAGPLAGKPVARVIVTHYHPDHIGLAGWFQERGAELWTTRTSWLFARMLVLDAHDRPVPEAVEFWRAAGMDSAMVARRLAERPFNFADCVAPLPLGYRRLRPDETVRIGGRDWVVRMGHGHAPEHATFWCEADPLVIGGDQILPRISPNIGVYATEPDADPLGEWLAAIAAFSSVATDDQLVLPGHKTPFRGLPRRLREMADHHHQTLDRLRAFLAAPATAAGCFDTIYRRPIGEAEYGLALVEAVAHLNHLLHAGRAVRWRGDDGAWLWQSTG